MANLIETRRLVETSLDRVQRWVQEHNYRGYEPFDGLSSWFRPLTLHNLFAERLLMQLVRQSPVNLRPLMGITPKDSTKGRGYMAHGYLFRYKTTGNRKYVEVARSAIEYSCSHQLPDGAWWYAETPHCHWIDNFHTGYNLDSLKCYIESGGDETWRRNFRRGLDFYKRHLFEDDGCPKYYHDRRYPVDSQCAAQAIESLASLSSEDPEYLELAIKVAQWTIENMQ